MRSQLHRHLLPALVALVLVPSLALAAGVEARFDLLSPGGGPFPSDRFAVEDDSHLTGVRVNLPKPDCATRPSDCADVDVINTLDGFNVQPRLAIPFTGPIDVSTVSSHTVFLVSLGDAEGGHGGKIVGINQVVWDPEISTLYAESDELLDQHTRYALIVTNGVRDTAGHRVEASASFRHFRHGGSFDHTKDHTLTRYRKELLKALEEVELRRHRVVAASVFTTQSVTAVLEKIRRPIKKTKPGPAPMLGTLPLSDVVP